MKKKAQIQVTFNWFYILIAGAVILLFFVGIVFKQKAASEERLSGEVVRVMESIFTSASVSEKTKNVIDTSGLTQYELYFRCEEGVGEYGIKGSPARAEAPVEPIFAPLELSSPQLIAWSLPYKMPYKVIDFLFISASNVKYVLTGVENEFINEFMNASNGFNVEYQMDLEDVEFGRNYHLRIVDSDGSKIKDGGEVPSLLKKVEDSKISAVVLVGDSVNFFSKKGKVWKKLNKNPLQIVSLGAERDAAKYAAVFSGDDVSYMCNMKKAFVRLGYLNEVYEGKAEEIVDYYEQRPTLSLTTDCVNHLKSSGYNPNVMVSIQSIKNNVEAACLVNYPVNYGKCASLIESASSLQEANENLGSKGDCVTLY